MIRQPSEVMPDLKAVVEEGKRLVFHFSPETKVTVTSTNPAEAQQILQALQPVEEEELPALIRGEATKAIVYAFGIEPVATRKWIQQLLEMMEEE